MVTPTVTIGPSSGTAAPALGDLDEKIKEIVRALQQRRLQQALLDRQHIPEPFRPPPAFEQPQQQQQSGSGVSPSSVKSGFDLFGGGGGAASSGPSAGGASASGFTGAGSGASSSGLGGGFEGTSAGGGGPFSSAGSSGSIAAMILATAIAQGIGDRQPEGSFLSRFQEGALPSPAKNLGLTEGSEFNAKEFGIGTFLPFLNFFREPNTPGQEDGGVVLQDLGLSEGQSGNNRNSSGGGGFFLNLFG